MGLDKRVKEVMGEMPPGAFAKACGVSAASVTFWLDGSTKALRADPVAMMEAKFGYRASWIVTGKGPKKLDHAPDAAWRFSEELQRKVLQLDEGEMLRAENVLRAHLGLSILASGEANKPQLIHDKTTPVAYGDATEDGLGIPAVMQPPEPIKRGSKQHQRRERTKGRGST